MTKKELFVLISLLLIFFVIGAYAIAKAEPAPIEHHMFDGVPTVNDIPYGECRVVLNPPRPLDRLTLNVPQRMCNTLGVVVVEDIRAQHI